MTAEPDLISLLYHADWRQLSLSAEVNDGSALLIAPGRRYRLQTPDYLTGCDGDRPWKLCQDDAEDEDEGTVRWFSGPEPPLRSLLCPAWLLKSSRLEVTGHVSVLGRDALQVVATREQGLRGTKGPDRFRAGRTEALVDAELGILLRLARTDGTEEDGGAGHGSAGDSGERSGVIELVSLDLSPVIDPAQFAPPPGCLIGESLGESLGGGGLPGQTVKTIAGLAAGALGAWIRYSPSGHRQPPDITEAAIPPEDPAPEPSPDGWPSGPQVSDEILHLLHGSGAARLPGGGATGFAATRHVWLDIGAMLSRIPPAARRAGFGGLGLLADSIAEQPSASHLVSAVRIWGPGQYQVDFRSKPRDGATRIVCDGQRRWRVYRDKVTVGPAEPAPGNLGYLTDPSWLLECRLSRGEQVTAGDRPAFRINVARGDAQWSVPLMFPATVAVVDAELGVLLRLTSYLGGKPVQRDGLQDITLEPGGFRADIPSDLPVSEEDRPSERAGRNSVNIPLTVARVVAQQAATGAAQAARNILRRFDSR